jgi:hypothetical protein
MTHPGMRWADDEGIVAVWGEHVGSRVRRGAGTRQLTRASTFSHPRHEDRTTGTRLWCSLKVPSIAAWAPRARPKCLQISIWATPSILIFWFAPAEATEEVDLQGFQAL